MTNYSYTKDYLTRDGQPWFPVMGEFHYSRYPENDWQEELYKMKAGGVGIVATYVIWIHHEEIEGEYDFSGSRDLRRFVELIQKCGLKLFLRIGPWCHGEVRNGGFPDWLLQKGLPLRTDDAGYLNLVRRYYAEIARQVDGLLAKDGGPIIGIQIENEYGHCGGQNGEAGEQHMRTLTALAREVGLEVPLYTATGWGGAVTGGLLPVMGGYCEAPWDQRTTKLEPNENYIFTNDRSDPNIGSDYGKKNGITYDITAFPYLMAELGGGLQVTHHRRPVARAKDIGAMSLTKLGSGVNLLGYYMYHGGTNPKGKRTTLQESRASGYPNDLPVWSYDFSAPIREYGQMSETLNEIKLLALFLQDFGRELCEMNPVWDGTEKQNPEDFGALRTAIRKKGRQGYLFVNNYQRSYAMNAHLQECLRVELEGETICYPPRDIQDGDFFFLPFYMPVGDGLLKSALATPLCRILDGEKLVYLFYTDTEPCYVWEKQPSNAEVWTISRKMALHVWRAGAGKEYVLITEEKVIEKEDGYTLLIRNGADIRSYPELPSPPDGYEAVGKDGAFYLYRSKNRAAFQPVSVPWRLKKDENDKKRYEIELPDVTCRDCFLRVDFSGDQAKLFVDGQEAGDWFYTGETWEIGMKRFGFPKKVEIEITALYENAPIFLETKPEFMQGTACRLERAEVGIELAVELGGIR